MEKMGTGTPKEIRRPEEYDGEDLDLAELDRWAAEHVVCSLRQ